MKPNRPVYNLSADGRLLLSVAGFLHLFRGAFHDLIHPAKGNIAALDLLRSAAILLVFTGHFVDEYDATTRVKNLPISYWGWTGVDLFFVLSGLLIGSQLWRELAKTGKIRIGTFLLRRGLRIWPLYFSFVAFVAAETLLGRRNSGIWADVFFVSNYFHCQIAGGWSLSSEEQFYILTPVLLSLFALILRQRKMWVVPLVGVGCLVAFRAATIHHSGLGEAALRQKMYLPIHTHADGLAVGLFLSWISVYYPKRLSSAWFAAASSSAMLVLGLTLYASSRLLFNFTALGLIYGAFVMYGISVLPFPSVLRWRGFYVTSRLSFGLYLNHVGVLSRLHPILIGWRTRGGEFGFWGCYLLSLAACLLVAALTFQFIEWPFLRIRAIWLDRRKSFAASSPIPLKHS